jgi:DNA-binding transcriptional LysR family regulator
MDRREFADLIVFRVVAEAGSFTAAAHRLARSQSSVSQTISALEARLGLPLLSRTTRSLRPTAAGERLLQTLGPALGEIEAALAELKEQRGGPSGELRITSVNHAAKAVLLPKLRSFMAQNPNVQVEISINEGFEDIVTKGFDAGVRFGAHLDQDMIAVPISPDTRVVVVASADYLARRGTPQRLRDLGDHDCIGYRLHSSGGLYRWQFHQDGKPLSVAVASRLTVNDGDLLLQAAEAGMGLAYMFASSVTDALATGRLVPSLQQYCPVWPGYQLYFPSRRRKSPALAALVDHLRT